MTDADERPRSVPAGTIALLMGFVALVIVGIVTVWIPEVRDTPEGAEDERSSGPGAADGRDGGRAAATPDGGTSWRTAAAADGG